MSTAEKTNKNADRSRSPINKDTKKEEPTQILHSTIDTQRSPRTQPQAKRANTTDTEEAEQAQKARNDQEEAKTKHVEDDTDLGDIFDATLTTEATKQKETTPSDEEEESEEETNEATHDNTQEKEEKEEEEGENHKYCSKEGYIRLLKKIHNVYKDDTILSNMSGEELKNMLRDVIDEQLTTTSANIPNFMQIQSMKVALHALIALIQVLLRNTLVASLRCVYEALE